MKAASAASPDPLPLPVIEAAFKSKGRGEKSRLRLPDTPQAPGRAQQEGGGWQGLNSNRFCTITARISFANGDTHHDCQRR